MRKKATVANSGLATISQVLRRGPHGRLNTSISCVIVIDINIFWVNAGHVEKLRQTCRPWGAVCCSSLVKAPIDVACDVSQEPLPIYLIVHLAIQGQRNCWAELCMQTSVIMLMPGSNLVLAQREVPTFRFSESLFFFRKVWCNSDWNQGLVLFVD